MISLVIPTYEEAGVIETALRRAAIALGETGDDFELIVVDDSAGEETAERARAVQSELPVRVLRREGKRGLATAVVEGWKLARGDLLGVMDADLQHPPEVLTRLVDALQDPNVDVAVASRHVPGGGSPDWSLTRRVVSWLTAHFAACVLPWTLATVYDPMSGMFLMRAGTLSGVELRPLGYKILLEVLARGRWRSLVEVPYAFNPRREGSSKLGARQSIEYLLHLLRLARATGQLRAWIRYALVGFGGALIDVALLWLLVRYGGWRPLAALPVAVEFALLSNFAWNQAITFRQTGDGGVKSRAPGFLHTLVRYERVCLIGAGLNLLATMVLLNCGFGLVAASSIGVAGGGLWNLIFNVPRIWQAWSGPASPPELGRDATSEPGRSRPIGGKVNLGRQ